MIIDELFEGPQLCPECGGISFSDLILAEKKDACYYKVKASAKVWPSAYASGRLVQCRKKGAANYGNKSEGVAEGRFDEPLTGWHIVYRKSGNPVHATPSFETKDQAQKYLMTKMFANHQDYKVVHTAGVGVAEGSGNWYVRVKGKVLKDKQFNAIPFPSKETATQKAFEIHNKKRIPLDMIKLTQSWMDGPETQGMAEQQELDEKWSQKYKKSINCANPKGFSQRAHCAGRKKNEDVEESLGKQIHSTFQTMGDSFSDAHLAKGISYFLQGRHQEGENWLRGKIPPEAQAAVFGKLKTLQAQGGVDVNKNPQVQQYINDRLVPWVKGQIQQGVAETRRGQIPMSNLKPGETDNYEPEDIEGYKKLPQYQQGYQAQQKAGKTLMQQSPFTFGSDQDWAYRRGAFDAQQAAMFANFGKSKPLTTEGGEQQPGADYRDPKEVDYDDEYDAMVARVKKLAGLGPLKTVYDPKRRVYRNMPTAVQPKK